MRALALIGLTLLLVLPLRGALDVGFLQDDFHVALVLGDDLQFDRATLHKLFRPPADEKDSRFRPATYVSLLADVNLFGLDPRLLHLSGLLLHLLSATLVFYLARVLWPRRPATAWIAALLFGLHPAHADAVGWLAARADPLLGASVLATAAAYARYRRHGGTLPAVACLCAYTVALLSKEPAVITPAWLVLLELGLRLGGRERLRGGGPIPAFVAIGALTVAYFGYRYFLFGRFLGEYGAQSASAWAVTGGGIRLATRHLIMPTPGTAAEITQLIAPLLALTLGVAAFGIRSAAARSRAAIGFALLAAAAAVALLPIVPFLGQAWGRHFYLPLVPITILLAAALAEAIHARGRGLATVGAIGVAAGVLTSAFCVRTLLDQYIVAGDISTAVRRDLHALRTAHPEVRTFVVNDVPGHWQKAPLFFTGFAAMTRPPYSVPAVPVIGHPAGERRDLRWDAFVQPRKPAAFLRVRVPPARPGLEPVSPIIADGPPRTVDDGYRLLAPADGAEARIDRDLAFRFEVPRRGPWPRPLRLVFRTAGGTAPFLLAPEHLREEPNTDPDAPRELVWRPSQGVSGGLTTQIFSRPPPAPVSFAWWIEEADLEQAEIRSVPGSAPARLIIRAAQ